ncbi:MAG TPA: efflux RND transporter periplasmic adaptor subunit [Candidatus Binatus sp.]|uniref:efflux RND transporter periplasmic adaptor subunit n=1 Tax=Candidatus Binatus sp. TaxID=2811406 RepID=UPI002B474479|nr:efflux RND transporter periplasmic adaptor subunit [Candidatus Binatus sp.]HKN14243.1 efflux RND transporter periplasmic adaptor subunit [Candidatus Binatus sp.]
MNRRNFNPIALAVLAAGISIAGCHTDSAGPAAAVPEATPVVQLVRQQGVEVIQFNAADVPGLKMVEVQNIEMPGILETSGQITYDDRSVSTIVSRVQGRIEQTRVSLWDNVQRGEKIVALYSPDFMTAESEYLQAHESSTLIAAPGVGGTSDFASALSLAAKRKLQFLGMSDADIKAIKAPDPTVWMRAPISGTVVDNKVQRGAAVNPGDVLFSLGTLDDVWITGDIYEDDLARVRVGQELSAVTTAFPDEVFKGVIARISPNVDPTTHTLQIRCEVKNPGGKLKPQMLAKVSIVTRPGEALVIPQDALVFDIDNYYAFVEVSPGMFEHRKVSIASWSRVGYARVVSGLKAGDRVVSGETLQVNALWHQAHGESS